MVEISGNAEVTDDPYRLTVIVSDTRDFTSLELAHATAIAVKNFVPFKEDIEPNTNMAIWMSGRFGKLLKRLKPKYFAKMIETVEGYLYVEGNVSLFVIQPFRRSELPTLAKKAQVSGLQLLEDEESNTPKTNLSTGIRITLNNSLNMSASKAAIAAAHALQLLRDSIYSLKDEPLKEVFENSEIEVVWSTIDSNNLPEIVIRDAGLTEVTPGSITAVAGRF